MLLFEHIPFPARTYNIFPSEVRLTILKKFLKVYSWEPHQMHQRCIDVYENVAADVYKEALVRLRKQYTEKFGASPSLWKAHPPQWCMKKVWVWQGLCDLYEKEGWQGLSKTNCVNKALDGGVPYHVAGPRSKHKVEQQLIKENPQGVVTSKDVFDKMHKKVLPDGTSVYVNARLADVAVTYDFLKALLEAEGIRDDILWKEASGKELRKGIFGFGYRSIIVESPVQLMDSMSTRATNSTAACSSREREREKEIDARFTEMERKHKEEMSEVLKRCARLESIIQNSNRDA